ncbi:unnamed protein product, partial [Callosobruchus maculatus]
MANLVLDMPCVKAAVPRRDVFLNPNDQMRRNLYLNTLLKIYQTLLLRHRYTLKKKHKYYGQVQLGMAVLNLSKCY